MPTVGLANSTEDPKIASDLAVIQTVINGNIDDTNLYAPNNGVRRLLLQSSGALGSLFTPPVAGTYILCGGNAVTPNLVASSSVAQMWAGDSGLSSQPADFQVANLQAYGRVRASLAVNATAPGVTFAVGLWKLTGLGGGAGAISYQLDAAVLAGSAVTFTTPTLQSASSGESTQFVLPTDAGTNPYVFAVGTSGTMAANSFVAITAQLYAYNA